jgi:ferritin-like metal-binding protein YciE
MKIESLHDLFVDQLKDLYHAELQLLKALPKMAKAAGEPELKDAFTHHLEETREHVSRLEQVFADVDFKPRSKTCEAMQGLIEQAQDLIKEKVEPHVRDAGLICAAQKVEHYEIAGYGCLRTWARQLGHDHAAELLRQTLEEESRADEKLTQIAEAVVNAKLVHAQA